MADTTLTADQGIGDVAAFVAGVGPAVRGFLIKIDSELELVTWHGDQFARPWQVDRGVLGTAAAAHSNGATVTVNPTIGSLTADEKAAVDAASAPTGLNPLATLADLAETFWTYDFANDGGAQGSFVLHGPAVPINAFVNAAFIQVITPFTSGGSATVALTTGEAANDIQTAVAFDNAALAAGFHTPSVKKLATASRHPALVIAAADLTAGKIKVALDISEGWG